MINFEKRENLDIITFTVVKLDALIVDEVRNRIQKVFENPNSKVIIDLKGIEYIDSSGFGCFLNLYKTSRDNYGTLKFAAPEPNIRSLFETLHLHTVFELFSDTESCIRSFRQDR
jgi:anti-sigma B factor antagonist